MAKKKATKKCVPRQWSPRAVSEARRILAYSKDVLGGSTHENHKRACEKLFGVPYVHANMQETRSYISHVAGIIRAKRKSDALFDFLKLHLAARVTELQEALHPEDEQHLVLMLETD